ncbi:MAG: SET domain-containing protein-lysine N-methyltransferase [Pseudomonadales bacterium]|nr:SET domain-containing protein-lysine N-methyltransferase [Pseudomonadales bacterium]
MAKSRGSARRNSVYVGESAIHGKGLFAAKKIKEGDLLGVLDCKAVKKDGPHVLWVDEGKKGTKKYKVMCDFKYINHSSKPNVAYYDDLTVVALKDIKANEELTHHYGDEWE